MTTKNPQPSTELETAFFQLRETAPNLKNKKSKENHLFARPAQRLFSYFDNERLTLKDAFCFFMLGFVSLLLITNIHTDLSAKKQANLLGVRTEMAVSPPQIKVINPIPLELRNPISLVHIASNDCQAIENQEEIPAKKNTDIVKKENKKQDVIAVAPQKVVEPKKAIQKPNRKIQKPRKKSNLLVQAKPAPIKKAEKRKTPPPIKKKRYVSNKKNTKVVSTWQQTQNKAIQEGKSSFILFGASYCMPCKMMKDVLQKHQNVKSYLDDNYRYEYVDIQSGVGALMRLEYNVESLPTMLVFDKNGQQVARYEEALSSQRLLSVLESYQSYPSSIVDIPASKKKQGKEKRQVELQNIIADVQQTYMLGKEK